MVTGLQTIYGVPEKGGKKAPEYLQPGSLDFISGLITSFVTSSRIMSLIHLVSGGSAFSWTPSFVVTGAKQDMNMYLGEHWYVPS